MKIRRNCGLKFFFTESAGIKHTPLQVSAEGLGTGAKAGIAVDYVGAEVGAHLGEVSAAGFGIRAGVKFGGAVENNIPVVHLGFVSVPCTIM